MFDRKQIESPLNYSKYPSKNRDDWAMLSFLCLIHLIRQHVHLTNIIGDRSTRSLDLELEIDDIKIKEKEKLTLLIYSLDQIHSIRQ